ncbi:MAG: protein kinase [Chloroflexi bacterium]|nr:protein kinase [Chloroflexota bacterium]
MDLSERHVPTARDDGGEAAVIRAMDPKAFEALVRDLLAAMGYRATLTKASHDGGVDVEAVNPAPIIGGKVVVQCKRYTGTIRVSAVRELYGVAMHAKASKGILITTSDFSADALRFAQDKPIELIDGQQLLELLREFGLWVSKGLAMLAGRYRIVGGLGEGGMATVHRAEDRALGRTVAVKVLREQYAADPASCRRFQQEARLAASLSHPHIVGVFDAGESDGRPFLVMEYVEGPTLKEVLRRGPLPVAQAVEIAVQTCAAVAFAHAHGIVHRDIKPQNILLKSQSSTSSKGRELGTAALSPAAFPDVKLADFGIARALSSASLSETMHVLGSVHYLSPEQAQGKAATPASDVYSIGVVLYEMLAGRPPFEGETVVGVAVQHIQQPPPLLRERNPQVTPLLEGIVLKAMAKDPEKRYASAEAMARALREYRELEAGTTMGVPALKGGGRPPSGEATPFAPTASTAPTPTKRRAGRARWLTPLLLMLALATVLILWILLPPPPGTPTPRSQPTALAVVTIAFLPTVTPALISTSTPVPPPTPSVGAAETLGRFYTLADQRQYEAAYELIGSKIKATAPYSVFTSWFTNKLSLRQGQEAARLVSQQDKEAEVEAVVWSSDRTDGGVVTQKFRERWKLVVEGGAWRLDTRLETTPIEVGATSPFATPTPCLSRDYPEKDDAGNVYLVWQWCDGFFSRKLVQAAPTATPVPTATPTPAVDPLTIRNVLENALTHVKGGSVEGTGVVIRSRPGGYTVLTSSVVVAGGKEYAVQRPNKAWGAGRVVNQLSSVPVVALEVTFPRDTGISYIPVLSRIRFDTEVDGSWIGQRVFTRCYADASGLIREGRLTNFGSTTAPPQGSAVKWVWLTLNLTTDKWCDGAPLLNAAGELIGIVAISGAGGTTAASAIPKLIVP